MKIVVSRSHGGFHLSVACVLRWAELTGIKLYPHEQSSWTEWWKVPPEERRAVLRGHAWALASEEDRNAYTLLWDEQHFSPSEISRTDPHLVQAIEELGSVAASGSRTLVEVVDVPDDVKWHIEEYDGKEWVAEDHRTW